MQTTDLIEGLPGAELVSPGLADYQAGRITVGACLIGIALTKLARAGLVNDSSSPKFAEPEMELYRLLRQEGGDAYSRYNALIRQLVSFEQALDQRLRAKTGLK